MVTLTYRDLSKQRRSRSDTMFCRIRSRSGLFAFKNRIIFVTYLLNFIFFQPTLPRPYNGYHDPVYPQQGPSSNWYAPPPMQQQPQYIGQPPMQPGTVKIYKKLYAQEIAFSCLSARRGHSGFGLSIRAYMCMSVRPKTWLRFLSKVESQDLLMVASWYFIWGCISMRPTGIYKSHDLMTYISRSTDFGHWPDYQG